MPGPTSDSYDPEFSTGSNAQDVADGIREIVARIDGILGTQLKDIVEVTQGLPGRAAQYKLTERDLRIIRFGLNRALESI